MRIILLVLFISIIEISCSNTVTGKLTNADTHFAVSVESESNTFASFTELKANSPACIVTSNGEVVYLNTLAEDLADYCGEIVKVKGEKVGGMNTITPKKMWIKNLKKWLPINL